MKRLILTIIVAFCMSICYSQDVVHLNNGRLVKGTIVQLEEGVSLTIRTENGNEYTYPFIEIKSYNRDKGVIIPEVDKSKAIRDYGFYNRGFWAAIETDGGYLLSRYKDGGYAELHFTGGYRFNEHLKVGAGFGGRYYINNKAFRCKDYKWSFPLFATVRGNIIPEYNRSVVPFYSAEVGAAINDGFYFRPALGVRFGEPRSAFLLALTYTAQSLKDEQGRRSTTSFVGLRLGWEF